MFPETQEQKPLGSVSDPGNFDQHKPPAATSSVQFKIQFVCCFLLFFFSFLPPLLPDRLLLTGRRAGTLSLGQVLESKLDEPSVRAGTTGRAPRDFPMSLGPSDSTRT